MDGKVLISGAVVGFLVGLTGVGGGSLMTPVLILLLSVRATTAVGTDLVFSAATKALGSLTHIQQRTVDWSASRPLLWGGLPGTAVGVLIAALARRHAGTSTADTLVARAVGVMLIVVALAILMRPALQRWAARWTQPKGPAAARPGRVRVLVTVGCGALIGLVVGSTSIGSGALVVTALLILQPALPLRRVVGTDMVVGFGITAVAGGLALLSGTANLHLAGQLLVGSLIGVYIGSRLSARVPEQVLRPTMAAVLMLTGLKLA
jgi:uncharacterized membrane protein YfcA